jgi:uncharacterized membrane protein
MRIRSMGRAVFAATLVVIGTVGLLEGGLSLMWEDLRQGIPHPLALGDLCALVSLACGAGLLWRRTAAAAARTLLALFLLWFLTLKLRYIVAAPAAEGSYQSCGESAVMVAAAWVLYARLASDRERRGLAFATGERGVRIARVIYALALIAFGLSHFAYLGLTAPLVPSWLPWHVGWAYFTGSAYLAAGIAILLAVWGRLAAALSALQMGCFTLLVWVPVVAAGGVSRFDGSEFFLSWALTAAGWVIADSYRGEGWLAVRPRPLPVSRREPVGD